MKLVRYFFVGAAAAAVDIGLFALLVHAFGFHYLLVGAVTFVLATGVNYALSVRVVFQSGVRFARAQEIALVFAVSAIGLAVNQVVLFVGVEQLSLPPVLAKVMATGTVFFWNYWARAHFVFKPNLPGKLPPPGAEAQPASAYSGAGFLLRVEEDLRNYNEWIVDSFVASLEGRLPKEAKVLDFGCGIGTLSRIFAGRTGLMPEGVELDAMQRDVFRERGFRAYASLSEAQSAYDVIFTSNVLEHIEDDVATLRALRERLAPGGVLLVYVPAFKLLWSSLDDKVGHLRRYTKEELDGKLESCGYRVRESRYCDSLGFGLAILFRIIGSRDGEPSSRSLYLFDRFLVPVSKLTDLLLSRVLGKNVFAVAEKDSR